MFRGSLICNATPVWGNISGIIRLWISIFSGPNFFVRKGLTYAVAIALPLVAAVAFVLFLGDIASTIAQNGGPQMAVTPNQAVANQRISLNATGFTAGSEIGKAAEGTDQVSAISIGGEDIPWERFNGGNTANVDSGGNWSTSLDLPLTAATTAAGSKTIQATDSEGITGSVAEPFQPVR